MGKKVKAHQKTGKKIDLIFRGPRLNKVKCICFVTVLDEARISGVDLKM